MSSSFIDKLEFSVRTNNVLKMSGITTREHFLNLSKEEVMNMPNVGRKTWNEVFEVQQYLKGEGEAREVIAYTNRAIGLARELNECLAVLDNYGKNLRLSVIDSEVHLFQKVT